MKNSVCGVALLVVGIAVAVQVLVPVTAEAQSWPGAPNCFATNNNPAINAWNQLINIYQNVAKTDAEKAIVAAQMIALDACCASSDPSNCLCDSPTQNSAVTNGCPG